MGEGSAVFGTDIFAGLGWATSPAGGGFLLYGIRIFPHRDSRYAIDTYCISKMAPMSEAGEASCIAPFQYQLVFRADGIEKHQSSQHGRNCREIFFANINRVIPGDSRNGGYGIYLTVILYIQSIYHAPNA